MQGVHIEELSREAGALSEQQRAAIVADAPELAGLLQKLLASTGVPFFEIRCT